MTRLDGKTVIITGAGAGLGREYARAIAAGGAHVVVNDVDAEAAAETVELIAADGGSALAVAGSVASWDDTERVTARAVETFGGLDGLVANAAIMHLASPWEEEERRLRAIAEVNILGVQFCVRHAMRRMVKSGRGGSIVTVVSGAQFGIAGMSAYGASKGAVTGMTANLALEGAAHGIRVNAVSPWALTQMTVDHLDPALAKPEEFPQPSAIAPLVVALLSDDLAHVNGRTIRFDGRKVSQYCTSTELIAEREGWGPSDLVETLATAIPSDQLGSYRSVARPS